MPKCHSRIRGTSFGINTGRTGLLEHKEVVALPTDGKAGTYVQKSYWAGNGHLWKVLSVSIKVGLNFLEEKVESLAPTAGLIY